MWQGQHSQFLRSFEKLAVENVTHRWKINWSSVQIVWTKIWNMNWNILAVKLNMNTVQNEMLVDMQELALWHSAQLWLCHCYLKFSNLFRSLTIHFKSIICLWETGKGYLAHWIENICYLSDPDIPDLIFWSGSLKLTESKTFLRLDWCDLADKDTNTNWKYQ